MKELEDQLEQVHLQHEMEQRTASMLHHMHLRIYKEIGNIRKVSEATIIALEKNRGEFSVIENTLRYLRQEGSVQERQYEELTTTTRSRKEQMVSNKSQLNYIMNRSENSIVYAKHTDFEVSRKLPPNLL
jgi:ribosomal protein S25